MMRVRLQFPVDFFKKNFLDCIEKGSDIKGDVLIQGVKEKYAGKNPKGILFSDKITYNCTRVGDNMVLIGAA